MCVSKKKPHSQKQSVYSFRERAQVLYIKSQGGQVLFLFLSLNTKKQRISHLKLPKLPSPAKNSPLPTIVHLSQKRHNTPIMNTKQDDKTNNKNPLREKNTPRAKITLAFSIKIRQFFAPPASEQASRAIFIHFLSNTRHEHYQQNRARAIEGGRHAL